MRFTTTKRVLSLVLCLVMVISVMTVGAVSVGAATNDVAETSAITKANAFSSGLWVDTQADEITDETDVTALVKCYKRDDGSYRLYLPSGVDSEIPVYHNYSNLSINGKAINAGDTFAFADNTTYNLTGDVNTTLKVYKSANVYTMYMTGSSSLPTKTDSSLYHKDKVERKGGNIYTADENGAIAYQDTVSKIKGRGNSSWEASYKLYGKYAYNLTTTEKNKAITGGDVKTKKYSMLANNMDESGMRNLFIYSLADAIGLDYTPTIRTYDFYDNGNYHGTYSVCEKVEVGKSGLLSGVTSLDDANEKMNPNFEDAPQKNNGKSSKEAGFYKYVDTPSPEDITGGYLLEFELSERFDAEISGFVSNEGQSVVIKYPEYATKEEVKYIMDLFNKAEDAVYSSNANVEEIAKYIDVESFAKMYLIQEMSKNIDAAQTSFYIYKESDSTGDGRLHASPVWDYDWTCGQYDGTRPVGSGGDSSLLSKTGWTTRYRKIDNNSGKDVNLQAKLCACDGYWDVVQSVWYTNFKDTAFSYVFDDSKYTLENSDAMFSEFYATMKDTLKCNESRWGFIAKDLTASWGSHSTGSTVDEVVNYLNDWIFDRLTWMNSNIGSKPSVTAPTLKVTASDANGTLATNGTADAPVVVMSDVTLNFKATSSKAMDVTFTVNGEKVKPDANGNVTVKVAEDGVAEITYKATAKDVTTVSTDKDGIATAEGTIYVSRKAPEYYLGDTDLDSVVSINDATEIQRYCAFITELSDVQIMCADVNLSGDATIMDVTNLQRYLAQLSCADGIGTLIEK